MGKNQGKKTHLTDERIAEIKKRCEQATLGPWKSYIEKREKISGSSFIQTAGEDIYLTGRRQKIRISLHMRGKIFRIY